MHYEVGSELGLSRVLQIQSSTCKNYVIAAKIILKRSWKDGGGEWRPCWIMLNCRHTDGIAP